MECHQEEDNMANPLTPFMSSGGLKAISPMASATGRKIMMPLLSGFFGPQKAGSHAEAKTQDQARVKKNYT
jgi:hypothetical protein